MGLVKTMRFVDTRENCISYCFFFLRSRNVTNQCFLNSAMKYPLSMNFFPRHKHIAKNICHLSEQIPWYARVLTTVQD